MEKYMHKAVNKTYITSEEIKSRLGIMKQLDLKAKEPEYNLIVLNTPNGQLKIKTKLTAEEWIKKYKTTNKKNKNVQTFEE